MNVTCERCASSEPVAPGQHVLRGFAIAVFVAAHVNAMGQPCTERRDGYTYAQQCANLETLLDDLAVLS